MNKGRVALPTAAQLVQDAPTDLGACPFCGKAIRANVDTCEAFHALPACETFQRLDAMDFVIAVRKARSASA